MIRFVRYAVLLLAGLALVVAWTAVDWDGPERPGVPAIELSPPEREGRQRPRRTDAERSEGRETRRATDPGAGAAPAPAPQPAPAGEDDEPDDEPDDDEVEGDERDEGDDGDD
jgi:hypothetical protein